MVNQCDFQIGLMVNQTTMVMEKTVELSDGTVINGTTWVVALSFISFARKLDTTMNKFSKIQERMNGKMKSFWHIMD
jgi:hypothetical protein